jgi:hypothetical protein
VLRHRAILAAEAEPLVAAPISWEADLDAVSGHHPDLRAFAVPIPLECGSRHSKHPDDVSTAFSGIDGTRVSVLSNRVNTLSLFAPFLLLFMLSLAQEFCQPL